MKPVATMLSAVALLAALTPDSADAQVWPNSPQATAHRRQIAQYRRECRQEARKQRFGIRVVQRNRFIRACMDRKMKQ